MASGSNKIKSGTRAGKGKKSPAKQRKVETLSQIRARIARTGDFF